MNNHDTLISKIFFKDDRLVIPYYYRVSKHRHIYESRYHNILEYLDNKYDDSDSIKETLYRILHNIDKHPHCKICGKSLMFSLNSKKNTIFPKYCSIKCEMSDKDIIDKRNKTCLEKYGSVNNSEKTKQTFIERYGGTSSFNSPEIIKKIKRTCKDKYGEENAAKSKVIKDKMRETCLSKYGVPSTLDLDNCRCKSNTPTARQKQYDTKKHNGTFNTSKPEEYCYEILCKIYPDIIRQYSSSVYPFNCDFYVPSQDLYIEYNGAWTHGGHFYDANNSADIELLNKWKEKNTKYYDNAIETWTVRDAHKLNTAIKNDLNYVVLWCIDDLFDVFDIPAVYNDNLHLYADIDSFNNEIDTYKRLPGKLSKSYTHSYIVKYYQQDTFYKKEKELWNDSKIKLKLIDNRVKYLNKSKEELTTNDILTGFKKSFIYYGYSAFNPMWIKWFHEKYHSKVCYDPCGGWGHRVLGSFNIDKYIYNDLSEGTYNNVCRMIDELHINNVDVYNNDCRDFMPLDYFDTMFTCPPYYNVEEYECGGFSSIDEYNKLIESLFAVFYQKSSCKVFGMVIREDLLEDKWKHLAVDKFDLTIRGANHMKIHKKYNEALFIFKKD